MPRHPYWQEPPGWSGAVCLNAAILVAVLACSDRGSPIERSFPADGSPGDAPVWAVLDHLEYGRVVVYPEPVADWQELVDLRLFAGFRPRMTFRDARRELGEPTRRGENGQGPYWDYDRPLGTVRIAHELKGSVPFVRWWRLKGFPISSGVEEVFHPNVSKHVPVDLEHLDVVIMNNDGSPGAFVQVEKGRITLIDWVNHKGSGGTRDGG